MKSKAYIDETIESFLAREGIIKKCPYHKPRKRTQRKSVPVTHLFTRETVTRRAGIIISRNRAA